MVSMSPLPDSGTLGDGMSFILFGVIHAAQRSALRLEEAIYDKRGVNMSVENEQKYRKTGVPLPPMHFHSMEKHLYTYAEWYNMWFGSRCEFVIHMWALLAA